MFVMSVRQSVRSHSKDFYKIWYLNILRKSVLEIQESSNLKRIGCTIHESQYMFMVISRSVLLRLRNFQVRICRKSQNTNFILILYFENRALYEIMLKNFAQQSRPQMTIYVTRRMCIACWIPKAKNKINLYNNYCLSM